MSGARSPSGSAGDCRSVTPDTTGRGPANGTFLYRSPVVVVRGCPCSEVIPISSGGYASPSVPTPTRPHGNSAVPSTDPPVRVRRDRDPRHRRVRGTAVRDRVRVGSREPLSPDAVGDPHERQLGVPVVAPGRPTAPRDPLRPGTGPDRRLRPRRVQLDTPPPEARPTGADTARGGRSGDGPGAGTGWASTTITNPGPSGRAPTCSSASADGIGRAGERPTRGKNRELVRTG